MNMKIDLKNRPKRRIGRTVLFFRKIERFLRRYSMSVTIGIVLTFSLSMVFWSYRNPNRYIKRMFESNTATIKEAFFGLDKTVSKLDRTIRIINLERVGDNLVMKAALQSIADMSNRRDSVLHVKVNTLDSRLNGRISSFSRVAADNKKQIDYILGILDSSKGGGQPNPVPAQKVFLREWGQN